MAEYNVSQVELSEKTGVRQATISDICTGKSKHIPLSVLDALCEFFNCQPSDIFTYKKIWKYTKIVLTIRKTYSIINTVKENKKKSR